MAKSFGLAHYLGYRRARTSIHFHVYFAIQTLIVIWLLLEFPAADLFSFLFFILGIQVMLALPTRNAVRWVLLFFLIEGASLLIRQGFDGIVDVLFNIPVYFLVAGPSCRTCPGRRAAQGSPTDRREGGPPQISPRPWPTPA